MIRSGVVFWVGVVLASALPAAAQEAPLLNVLPRPEQVRQLQLRADLKIVRKRYWEGIELYQQALDLAPRDPVLLNKMGIAYHLLLELKRAKKHYERATKADKTYAQAWNNLGAAYYGQKNYKRAVRHYRRAVKGSPAQAAIRSNLGTALFARKKYDQAMQEFRVALLLDPEVFQHRGSFGVFMQDQSVEDRARFYFLVAKSMVTLGYVERCITYLRRALEAGFSPVEAQGDPAFALLRDDVRFQAIFTQQSSSLEP
ncbi:MAG: tetratricopeptide repeat protein [Terriglobia bacterium]